VVWRGARMLNGIIRQFSSIRWSGGSAMCFVVDLPRAPVRPQLTLAQAVPMAGVVNCHHPPKVVAAGCPPRPGDGSCRWGVSVLVSESRT